MVALTELLNCPLRIGGKDVILVQDRVGDRLEDQGEGYALIAEGDLHRAALYVNEAVLSDQKTRFPSYAFYGLWQVLTHSGVLKPTSELQIIGSGPQSGVFARFDLATGRLVQTGEYIDGLFQRAGDLLLEQAVPIEFNISDLKLPAQEARLLDELIVLERRQKRIQQITAGVFALGVFAFAFVVDRGLQVFFDKNLESYEGKKASADQLTAELNQLERSKILKFPNSSLQLEQLQALFSFQPTMTLPLQNLNANQFVGILPKTTNINIHGALGWVQSIQLPNSDWKIDWQNPGITYDVP